MAKASSERQLSSMAILLASALLVIFLASRHLGRMNSSGFPSSSLTPPVPVPVPPPAPLECENTIPNCDHYPKAYCFGDPEVMNGCKKECGLCHLLRNGKMSESDLAELQFREQAAQFEQSPHSRTRANTRGGLRVTLEEVLTRICIDHLTPSTCAAKARFPDYCDSPAASDDCRRTCDVCMSKEARAQIPQDGLPKSMICPADLCPGGDCVSCAVPQGMEIGEMKLTCTCKSSDPIHLHCIEEEGGKLGAGGRFRSSKSCSFTPLQRAAAKRLCGIWNDDGDDDESSSERSSDTYETLEWSKDRIRIAWGDDGKAKSEQEFAHVPRVRAGDITVDEFARKYFDAGRPVVVQGIEEWDFGWNAQTLYDTYPSFRKPEASGGVRIYGGIASDAEFAQLASQVAIPDFVKKLCDRYFADGHEIQNEICKTPPNKRGADKTAVMFIKKRDSNSRVVKRHIDANCGSFWSIQIQGTKRWLLWPFSPDGGYAQGPDAQDTPPKVWVDLTSEFDLKPSAVDLQKGEVLVFSPGWWHSTVFPDYGAARVAGDCVDDDNADADGDLADSLSMSIFIQNMVGVDYLAKGLSMFKTQERYGRTCGSKWQNYVDEMAS